MKKLLIVLWIGIAVYIGLGFIPKKSVSASRGLQIKAFEGETEITQGDHRYVGEMSDPFSSDLRIFGFNDSPVKIDRDIPAGLMPIVTHVFVTMPVAVSRELFLRYKCEAPGMDKASMLQIMAQTPAMKTKIQELKQFQMSVPKDRHCIRISGKTFTLKRYFFRGEDATQTVRGAMTGGNMRFDADRLILLDSVDFIDCD